MQFHVMIKMNDSIVLDQDKRARQVLGSHLQKILASGKVRASGVLAGMRGGFFVLEINAPEELFELLGPEIYANFQIQVQPVVPFEKIGELFQKWAAEGR